MELSKPDLLQLLGVLEGELQAREIVIAVLKAEQVKQLLYPKRKSSPNDPWAALQRDCLGAFDATFDEAAVKNLYGMQMTQLEIFLRQYKCAQSKLQQQLQETEKRCEKLLAELEDEKRKHAQDTAQGDDVTYLLEKERERLHQENEFEKQQNRCMEKDIKCLTETLEQERARQKQIVLLLLAERKRLIFRYAEEKQKCDKLSQILCDEKGRIADMVDGLEEESKKSLQMEAELERQLCEFEVEREQYKVELAELEVKNTELSSEIQKLHEELELLQKQNSSLCSQAQLGEGVRSTIVTMVSTPTIRAVPTISPTVSPPRGIARAISPKVGPAPATPAKPPGLIPQAPSKMGSVNTSSKSIASTFAANVVVPPSSSSPLVQTNLKNSIKSAKIGSVLSDTSPVIIENSGIMLQSSAVMYAENTLSPPDGDKNATGDLGMQINAKAFTGVKLTTPVPANKPGPTVSPSINSTKKLPIGRGAPPPIPPNKPVLPPQALQRKDSVLKPPVPPRSDTTPVENTGERNLQRPVGAVNARFSPVSPKSTEELPHSIAAADKEETQVGVSNEVYADATTTNSNAATSNGTFSDNRLESDALVQELADFQQILVAMASNKLT